jgi:hypothetical protein
MSSQATSMASTIPAKRQKQLRIFCIVPMHVYEVRPRKDHRGVNLISDALPFGRL